MIYKNEKLSKYSWFNLGGPAEVFFKPNSIDDLKNFLLNQKIKKIKFLFWELVQILFLETQVLMEL